MNGKKAKMLRKQARAGAMTDCPLQMEYSGSTWSYEFNRYIRLPLTASYSSGHFRRELKALKRAYKQA